jgi:hypothetical protein
MVLPKGITIRNLGLKETSTAIGIGREKDLPPAPLYTFAKLLEKMSYIDNTGNVFLATEAPTEADRGNGGGYDNTMSFGTDLVYALNGGRKIPLWYSEEYRVTQLLSGYGFQIRQAELLKDSNEIITFSTVVSDGEGWGKLNGNHAAPGISQYAIMKFSAETGQRTGLWDFIDRRWTTEFNDYFNVVAPKNGDWSLLPQSADSKKNIFILAWENAVKDFPDFLDNRLGLKNGVSLGETQSSDKSPGADAIILSYPSAFTTYYADKITNFNPEFDKLSIDAEAFGINGSATVATAKNSKALNRLAKKGVEFVYNMSNGQLYFNENGRAKGFGDGGVCAIFEDVSFLTTNNLVLT